MKTLSVAAAWGLAATLVGGAAVPACGWAAEPVLQRCAVCEDVDRVAEAMRETVRSHASAKNAQLIPMLTAALGAACPLQANRPAVVCTALMPASGESWTLVVGTPDDAPGQEPYRITVRIEFPALRSESVADLRARIFAGWQARHLDPCRHEVSQPGPVPKTLLLAAVQGRWQGGCIDRVEAVEFYLISSPLGFAPPRIS